MPACQEIEQTPLQRTLGELGKMLLRVVLGIVVIMFALHVVRGGEIVDAFLLSVSLALAAVPGGLVIIALALGLQRMARRNALIRRLPSVETLGAVKNRSEIRAIALLQRVFCLLVL